jgi:prepilin-type N-terminal cleavage/methylation domain-containing protein
MRYGNRGNKGFTLIELLVVIAIIGVLSTLAVVAVMQARDKAKDARARGDVKQLATAVALLAADTGKWPNGCPQEAISNPELYLNAAQAGIATAPTVGDQGGGCTWAAEDIAKWAGPYMQASSLDDPWGSNYYFDPDYVPYQNCASKTAEAQAPAVVSFGPNATGPNAYDCDDIFYVLR